MDTWNRLTAFRGVRGKGDWMKEGEGVNQRTYTCTTGRQTTVWGRPEGSGGRAGWRPAKRQGRRMGHLQMAAVQ